MSDIATIYDPITGTYDWRVVGPSLEADDGLHTSVILSLFVDREADPDDTLPEEAGGVRPPGPAGLARIAAGGRRGWWGDAYADDPGDKLGSKLWLRKRMKATEETRLIVQGDCEAALAWLVTKAIAASVEVTTEWATRERLGARIVINRPDGTRLELWFDKVWEATA